MAAFSKIQCVINMNGRSCQPVVMTKAIFDNFFWPG